MRAMQAVGATLAGLTAQYLPVGAAMAVMAVASLAVTAALGPGLRRSDPRRRSPAGKPDVTGARTDQAGARAVPGRAGSGRALPR